jgi:hypothetical protein
MRQRIGGAPIVEQKEREGIVRTNVLRIGGEYTLESPPGFSGVAVLLTIQRGDGEVDLKILLFRVGRRQAREDLARLPVVELAHEPHASVVEGDHIVGRRRGASIP